MTHLPLRGALAPLTLTSKVPSSLVNGLLAYWKLEEASGSRADSAGSNTLTDNNTVTQGAGKIGNAAQFTAANIEYLNKTGTTFKFAGVDFTAAAWVNPTSLASAGSDSGRGIMRSLSGDTTGDWSMGVVANGGIRLYHWQSNGNDTTGKRLSVSSGLTPLSTWTHLVYRRSSGVYTLWVNGVSQSFTVAATLTGWGNVGFEMGRNFPQAVYSWDGLIDEAAIWDRGITDAEIATLYNSGAGNQYPFS